MDRLLAEDAAKSASPNFRFGLPGNLIPVRKGDYVNHNWAGAQEVGEPSLDDGSDAFQIYENGGATACYAYFTIKALYKLGRVEDARTHLPSHAATAYAAGEFQGFCDNGKSKDWRDWNGGCHGYEGLLCDGFLTLLCVAGRPGGRDRLLQPVSENLPRRGGVSAAGYLSVRNEVMVGRPSVYAITRLSVKVGM